jgi:phosphate transport system substrate-binding protein
VASSVSLNGAGATFPNPLYTKAFDEYNKFDSNVKINYQSIGSSGGIKNFTEKTVDFGGTDAFLTDQQLTEAGGAAQVFHIPTAIGAVVLTYNLPGFNGTLRMTPELLVDILTGSVKKWNDAKIKAENTGAGLPDAEIAWVHRSDGSGTTSIFTNYLAAVSPKWKSDVGAGTSVKWPVGIGAQGNEGVTGQIKNTPGALGYVELIYAEANKLPTMELKNKAGKYIKPSLQSTSAAAQDLSNVPDDLRATIVNASGDAAYPIAGFTWILIRKDQTDELKATALTNMLWWLTHDGQKIAERLRYAPLPAEIVAKVEPKLRQINVNGKPIIT